MKLKLFIMLIALVIAVATLLGGCGGNGGNKNDDRDNSIAVDILKHDSSATVNVYSGNSNGRFAKCGFDGSGDTMWMAVYREIINGKISVDTLYVLNAMDNTQLFRCKDITVSDVDFIDFEAGSGNPTAVDWWRINSNTGMLLLTDTTSAGKATITVTTANNKTTWFDVISIDNITDFPSFDPHL